MINSIFSLLLSLLSGSPAGAAAALPQVEVLKVKFRDIQYKQFKPSESVIIKVDPNDVQDAKTLRVRVFPGDPVSLRDTFFGITPGGCYIYDSAVFTGVIDAGGFIDFGSGIDKTWLRQENGVPVNSRFLLVIERNGRPDRKTLVYRGSYDEYFGRGYIFELVAPPGAKKSLLPTEISHVITDTMTPAVAMTPPPPPPPAPVASLSRQAPVQAIPGAARQEQEAADHSAEATRSSAKAHMAARDSKKSNKKAAKPSVIPPENGCIVVTTR